jgi:catechol 2,3-dioxygenase-like lactoylglutathione lyase family enzyme
VLDHVSIGVPDMTAAAPFWDAVMAALGYPLVGESDVWRGYGARADADQPDRTYLSLRVGPASPSACHFAFRAPDRAAVDAAWAVGCAAGGTDDGAPGLRPAYHPSYYAAFLRDPAGNRIECVCHRRA